jgi:hypothetical protein
LSGISRSRCSLRFASSSRIAFARGEERKQGTLAIGFAKALRAGVKVIHSQRRRTRASAALVELARTAGSTLRLEEVLDLVTERTATLVGADRCGLWLFEKERAMLPVLPLRNAA